MRIDLAQWTPPSPARVLTFSPVPAPARACGRRWRGFPRGRRSAAACCSCWASRPAIANFEIRVDDEGLTLRHWMGGNSTPSADADRRGPRPHRRSRDRRAVARRSRRARNRAAGRHTKLRTPAQRRPWPQTRRRQRGAPQVRTLIAASESISAASWRSGRGGRARFPGAAQPTCSGFRGRYRAREQDDR